MSGGNDVEPFLIPRRLDEPGRILIFRSDEASAFLVPFGVFLANDWVGFSFVAGFASFWVFRRMKTADQPNFIRCFWYWHAPRALNPFKKSPPTHIKRWVG